MIENNLIPVDLAKSQHLNSPDQNIEYCWFLESGIASVVATSQEGHETEVGIVGRDGMIDVATVLGVDRSPLRSFIQIPGSGFRIPARELTRVRKASPTFQAQLGRYAFDYLIQVAHTALANASFGVEERLARWLLMCGDRVGDEEITLTHEFLSTMLNVRRAGVTLAIQSLERAGLVKARRGALAITNRAALAHFARDAYAPFS
jgi:CRP-like cAMP-binding protein